MSASNKSAPVRRWLPWALAAAAVLGVGLVGVAWWRAPSDTGTENVGQAAPVRTTASRATKATGEDPLILGKRVYVTQCLRCHGASRQGQPNWRIRQPDGLLPPPPLDGTAHSWHHPDAQLFETVKKGPAALVPGYRSMMPSFDGTLSDQEIKAVIKYVKSQWPAAIRARHAQRFGTTQ